MICFHFKCRFLCCDDSCSLCEIDGNYCDREEFFKNFTMLDTCRYNNQFIPNTYEFRLGSCELSCSYYNFCTLS